MRRDRRKDLYRTERDSLEGPHDEAEIQRKALRRGKNLAFSKDTCLEKERVRSKVTPIKVGVGPNGDRFHKYTEINYLVVGNVGIFFDLVLPLLYLYL